MLGTKGDIRADRFNVILQDPVEVADLFKTINNHKNISDKSSNCSLGIFLAYAVFFYILQCDSKFMFRTQQILKDIYTKKVLSSFQSYILQNLLSFAHKF